MKHLSTMFLTLCLGALSAVGQNVTVVMKDGVTHKFNADYLSEIKFRDAGEQTPPVEFKQVEVDEYTSSCNYTLTFTDEEGTTKLVIDTYGPVGGKWFTPGQYKYDLTQAPNTFDGDPRYTYLEVGGEKKSVTGGTLDAKVEGHVFTFDINLDLEGDAKFKGAYVGELPYGSQWLDGELSAASYNENPQAPGTFYVKFNDVDWKYDIALVFNAAADATVLPAGEYTYSEIGGVGTVTRSSYFDRYYPTRNYRLAPGSKVKVTTEEGVYDIDMELLLDDGHTSHMTYHGAVSGTPAFEAEEPAGVEFAEVEVEEYSGGNVTLTLTDESGENKLVIDMYGTSDAAWLQAGTYNVGGSSPYQIDPSYSSLTVGGEALKITSGTVEVTATETSDYEFNIDLTLSNGETYKGHYSGKLPSYTQYFEATMSQASYNENPQAAGTFYVKFNDRDWKYDIALVLTAAADATVLPAGEYTLSETAAPGTVSSVDSYFDRYYPTRNMRLAEGSKVTVTYAGEACVITMNLKLDNGQTCTVTFNGAVSGTPHFN